MNLNSKLLQEACILASCLSILFTFMCAFFSVMAYAHVIGFKRSTHRIEWHDVPKSQDEDFILNKDEPEETEPIQDFPKVNTKSTLREQMEEHMYPDEMEEQVNG